MTLAPIELERFWAKVDKATDCWMWTASKNLDGYGKYTVGGKTIAAHRLAYELAVGKNPKALDHTCHDPLTCPGGKECTHRACVNPSHLQPTTGLVNVSPERAVSRQREKTHCARGHEFSEINTYRPARGGRMCRTCKTANDKARIQKMQKLYRLWRQGKVQIND